MKRTSINSNILIDISLWWELMFIRTDVHILGSYLKVLVHILKGASSHFNFLTLNTDFDWSPCVNSLAGGLQWLIQSLSLTLEKWN